MTPPLPGPSGPLRLRLLNAADLPFADSLRALAGWNQTLVDWERFLAAEPSGCFLAEWDGALAGTATTITYGAELAWIGMVLVHPDYRRRGIGRALLSHCIQSLRDRGIRSIKLDATPAGKAVYDALGFRDEWTLARWVGRSGAVVTVSEPRLRPWADSDASSVEALDTEAFGVSRRRLLAVLARQSRLALVQESESGGGSLAGFGMVRAGSRALYLGPVVAETSEAGIRLVEALLAHCNDQMVYWDIPDPNESAKLCAQRLGFTVQRPLTRMFLIGNDKPGNPQCQFAIAGPEAG